MKALEESIKHWERLSECETLAEIALEGITGDDCALCSQYADIQGTCDNCPVAEKAEFHSCINTPYGEAYACFYDAEHHNREFSLAEWKPLALAELNFLKSLREEVE